MLQSPKWYQLLHSKYSKSKPELRLCIYIDEENKGGEQSSFKAREAPARAGGMCNLTSVDRKAIVIEITLEIHSQNLIDDVFFSDHLKCAETESSSSTTGQFKMLTWKCGL